jgi:hypothetical protein
VASGKHGDKIKVLFLPFMRDFSRAYVGYLIIDKSRSSFGTIMNQKENTPDMLCVKPSYCNADLRNHLTVCGGTGLPLLSRCLLLN